MRVAVCIIFGFQFLSAWGSVGHKIINKGAVGQLPPTMKQFIDAAAFLEAHSTDADTRRTSDTAMFSEQYRHYLDVDDYPGYRTLTRSFDTLVQRYGWKRVKENGTNSWTTVWVMDSLTAQLKRGDWNTALQSAADLGHYVGDPHQPLHATANYNGQLTNNYGIHSRYESTMLGKYASQISIARDSLRYIDDVYGFAFDYILGSNALVDSILHADTYAKSVSGWNGSGTPPAQYYEVLWQQTGAMTKTQLQAATVALASLWYTAWVNAGLLSSPSPVAAMDAAIPTGTQLHAAFPNPFNPSTTVSFALAERSQTVVEVYALDGRRVRTLVQEELGPGTYAVRWDASELAGGVYVVRMHAGGFFASGRVVLIK